MGEVKAIRIEVERDDMFGWVAYLINGRGYVEREWWRPTEKWVRRVAYRYLRLDHRFIRL